MKTHLKNLILAMAMLASLMQTARAAVTFSVTPAAVSNTYNGSITLQIGGLTNTETVVVQKFLDLNNNGVIDGGDWLVQQFTLTDGQTGMVIGGVTNFNVPGDTDGIANGQITTSLFQNGDFRQHIIGNYLYRLSSPVGHFASITIPFAVTNFPFAQKFTGNVVSNNTSTTVPNAVVILFPPGGGDPPEAETVANNAGNYTISALPGTYSLTAAKSNYLGYLSTASVLTLGNGQTINTNITLTPATSSISGNLVDSGNSSIVLPGVMVAVRSASGQVAINMTDTNGNYNVPVGTGTWSIKPDDASLLIHGYLGPFNWIYTTVGTTGKTLDAWKATALIYGSVLDNLGNPMPGLDVYTFDSVNEFYETDGSYTDTNGNYVLGVLDVGDNDFWYCAANGDNQFTNYLFSQETIDGNLSAGQTELQDFTGILATNYITGWLKDNYGNPIAGVEIYNYDETPINGIYYDGNGSITDTNGNYSLNVCNGTWDIDVDDYGDNTSLPVNYVSPADQYPVISNNNAVVDFTATLLPPQITTVTLPSGTNGVAYNQQLSAIYGKSPYNWSLLSTSLPSNLVLVTSGLISGIPTNNGTFNFTVKVTDALTEAATQALALTVGSPPGVTILTTNSPLTVMVGTNLTLAVSVTGTGPFSYQWQLNGTNIPNGIITTVAGNGTNGYSGDGGAATNAELNNGLAGVAVDSTGNLFIADVLNHVIRKVGTNGIITTFAGNGTNGYSGDGGSATNAELDGNDGPIGVAVDATGNLFIADSYDGRIREVRTNGIITTVAGNGFSGGRGYGYFGDGGPATNAIITPLGVAVDATGNLFIADYFDNVIRKVATNGIITTVAGNGYQSNPYGAGGFSGDGGPATNAELYWPEGVAVTVNGNLFIVDSVNQRIRKVGTNGIINTVAGNGTSGYFGDGGEATDAELDNPFGVTVDAIGNIFISDSGNNVIREVDANGIITTVVGNGNFGYSGDGGEATDAELEGPEGVAVDTSGSLFFVDNERVRKVVFPGSTLVLNGVGYGNAGAYDVVISSPFGSVTSSVVNVIITPLLVATTSLPYGTKGVSYNQTLATFGGLTPFIWTTSSGVLPSGLILTTNGVISGTPTTNGTFNFTVKVTDALSETATKALALTVGNPPGVTIQLTNNSVSYMAGNNVTFSTVVTGTGPFSYQWQFNGNNLPNGIITTVAGDGTQGYSGDGGAATNAELNEPYGVAVDSGGNLFIADSQNYRVRKVGNNGFITTVAGNGTYGYSGNGSAATNAELTYPSGVAVDATGNLFIADLYNNAIRKMGINGIITTVAGTPVPANLGTGIAGYTGDGGAATNAWLNSPFGVTVDATGNLFIADQYNNAIRRVGTNGIINTVAGGLGAGTGSGSYSGDGGGATNAGLYHPSGVAVDATGNLFIADSQNYRVREVGTNGIINTIAGGYNDELGDGGPATNAVLNNPQEVALDATGNLFIADDGNDLVRKVATNGIITTVAGNGSYGYSGNGSAASNAELSSPSGVTVDATGNLFIADQFNNAIRKVVFYPSVLSPTLILNNVSFGNAGAYDVVISSPFGSVTSSVVNVTVTLPPFILSTPQITVGGTNFTFMLTGPVGSNYVLQVSTDLLNWSPVSTSTIPLSGSINLSNAISGYNRRFYRAVIP
jgi:hypothetical protein